VEILSHPGENKSLASSSQHSAYILGLSEKKTQIESSKCPLVKITTNKSDQKSNYCSDFHDNIEDMTANFNNDNDINDLNLMIDETNSNQIMSNDTFKNSFNEYEADFSFADNNACKRVNKGEFRSKFNDEHNKDIGDNNLNKRDFNGNSEVSFDQIRKFQFEYETQYKIKDEEKEIKILEGKDCDLDGIFNIKMKLYL